MEPKNLQDLIIPMRSSSWPKGFLAFFSLPASLQRPQFFHLLWSRKAFQNDLMHPSHLEQSISQPQSNQKCQNKRSAISHFTSPQTKVKLMVFYGFQNHSLSLVFNILCFTSQGKVLTSCEDRVFRTKLFRKVALHWMQDNGENEKERVVSEGPKFVYLVLHLKMGNFY